MRVGVMYVCVHARFTVFLSRYVRVGVSFPECVCAYYQKVLSESRIP